MERAQAPGLPAGVRVRARGGGSSCGIWRLMTTRGEQAIMFRRDIFNPLAHGLTGEFHNRMFRKRFSSATTLALSSLAPTVEEGDGRGSEEEHKLRISRSCLWPWDLECKMKWLGAWE